MSLNGIHHTHRIVTLLSQSSNLIAVLQTNEGEFNMSEPTTTTSTTVQDSGPVEEFRSGAVRATIWRNEIPRDGETVVVHNIQIYRTYRDQDGEWHESSSFRERDLLDLDILRQEAARFLRLRRRSDQNADQTPAADDDIPI